MEAGNVDTMIRAPQNDIFLRACARQAVPRTPLWFMRQAGRYLPEYRAVRARHDFLTMVRTPELAAEVTVQPVEILGVDAAILFSDIMVVPEAMGMTLHMVEGTGPVLPEPIRTRAQIDALPRPDPESALGYVMGGIRQTRRALDGRVPLIGFSGSPWTLAAYMVEGRGSKTFRHAKAMVYGESAVAHALLARVADAVGDYLLAQAHAGAQALQIFDTWGGLLPAPEFAEFSLAYIERVVSRLRGLDAPVIVFCKDCGHSLEAIADTGCDVIGIDWGTDLAEARRRVGARCALQGNLDPAVLFAAPEVAGRRSADVLERFGRGEGHIFNLGHGILPETPVESVRAMIAAVSEQSPRYHG
jgi:uroporphyrinogen decarboxylase